MKFLQPNISHGEYGQFSVLHGSNFVNSHDLGRDWKMVASTAETWNFISS